MEQDELLKAFVEFADTLVADYDIVDFLHRLAETCVRLLNVTDAGVMLAAAGEQLQYVASSSEQMRTIELLELQHEQGPCFDAQRFRERQISRSADESDRRWPQFGPHARRAGFESMAGIPLRLRNEVVGTINLFSTEPGGLTEDDQPVAQALADIATIGILQERAIRDGQIVVSQLDTALQSRVVIEQAKGILAERRRVTIDEAFTALRDYARSHNRKLTDTARDVAEGLLLPEAFADPSNAEP